MEPRERARHILPSALCSLSCTWTAAENTEHGPARPQDLSGPTDRHLDTTWPPCSSEQCHSLWPAPSFAPLLCPVPLSFPLHPHGLSPTHFPQAVWELSPPCHSAAFTETTSPAQSTQLLPETQFTLEVPPHKCGVGKMSSF